MSFEEIWISYLVGATLWLAPREIAGDPLVPARCADCAAGHGAAAHVAGAVRCRTCPVCASSIQRRDARNTGGALGHRVPPDVQDYGPTEVTVSASLAELKAGEPVTIGPLPNYAMLAGWCR